MWLVASQASVSLESKQEKKKPKNAKWANE